MNINDLNKAKLPIVTIDKSLEKYKNKVLFGLMDIFDAKIETSLSNGHF